MSILTSYKRGNTPVFFSQPVSRVDHCFVFNRQIEHRFKLSSSISSFPFMKDETHLLSTESCFQGFQLHAIWLLRNLLEKTYYAPCSSRFLFLDSTGLILHDLFILHCSDQAPQFIHCLKQAFLAPFFRLVLLCKQKV